MPILASQVWNTPSDYLIERPAVWGVLIEWWNMCAITIGRQTELRETPFGGYHLVVGVDPSFWGHTSSAWLHDQVITDLYAIAPAGGPPINVGTVNRGVTFYPSLRQYVLTISCIPNGTVGMWYRFPPAAEMAGSPLYPAQIPPAFYTVPSPPGVLFPVPYC